MSDLYKPGEPDRDPAGDVTGEMTETLFSKEELATISTTHFLKRVKYIFRHQFKNSIKI